MNSIDWQDWVAIYPRKTSRAGVERLVEKIEELEQKGARAKFAKYFNVRFYIFSGLTIQQ